MIDYRTFPIVLTPVVLPSGSRIRSTTGEQKPYMMIRIRAVSSKQPITNNSIHFKTSQTWNPRSILTSLDQQTTWDLGVTAYLEMAIAFIYFFFFDGCYPRWSTSLLIITNHQPSWATILLTRPPAGCHRLVFMPPRLQIFNTCFLLVDLAWWSDQWCVFTGGFSQKQRNWEH